MIMSVTSSKSLDELDQDFRKAVQRHKFGVLNVLDLKQTLGNKGIVLERECRVYDICNPQAASTALNTDMSVYRDRARGVHHHARSGLERKEAGCHQHDVTPART